MERDGLDDEDCWKEEQHKSDNRETIDIRHDNSFDLFGSQNGGPDEVYVAVSSVAGNFDAQNRGVSVTVVFIDDALHSAMNMKGCE